MICIDLLLPMAEDTMLRGSCVTTVAPGCRAGIPSDSSRLVKGSRVVPKRNRFSFHLIRNTRHRSQCARLIEGHSGLAAQSLPAARPGQSADRKRSELGRVSGVPDYPVPVVVLRRLQLHRGETGAGISHTLRATHVRRA